MATQYANDIPFTSSASRSAFKLLELPPALLAALESASPPTLTLTTSPALSAHALLTVCSPSTSATTTYQLRQKNTSNPIHVLAPSSTQPAAGDDPDAFVGRSCLASIAVVEDTIELIAVEEGAKAEEKVPKVNKWHEKFAKGRKS